MPATGRRLAARGAVLRIVGAWGERVRIAWDANVRRRRTGWGRAERRRDSGHKPIAACAAENGLRMKSPGYPRSPCAANVTSLRMLLMPGMRSIAATTGSRTAGLSTSPRRIATPSDTWIETGAFAAAIAALAWR